MINHDGFDYIQIKEDFNDDENSRQRSTRDRDCGRGIYLGLLRTDADVTTDVRDQ